MAKTIFKNPDLIREWIDQRLPRARNHSGVLSFTGTDLLVGSQYSTERTIIAKLLTSRNGQEKICLFAYGFSWHTVPYSKSKMIEGIVRGMKIETYSMDINYSLKETFDPERLVLHYLESIDAYVHNYYDDDNAWIGHSSYWFQRIKEAWDCASRLNQFFNIGLLLETKSMNQEKIEQLTLLHILGGNS